MSLKSLHTSTRSRLLGTALVLGLSGCRSCESKPPKTKVVKKSDVGKEQMAQRRQKLKEQRNGRGLAAQREKIGSIEMTIPTASEEVRTRVDTVERAMTLVLQGKEGITEARGLLTAHLAEQPTDTDALYWMARSYNLERVQVPAIEWYQKSLEAEPDFVPAHRWLAYTLHAEGRCKEARPHLDAAVEARSEQAGVYIDRAVCAMTIRDWDTVSTDLSKACELDSFDWCEDLPQLLIAEKRRETRRAKAVESLQRTRKSGKAIKGAKGLESLRLGRGKLGKLGKGKAKAAQHRNAAESAGTDDASSAE